MKIQLFDFQTDALDQLRIKLGAARAMASVNNPQAVSFSAPTGSGKTVMMTALFEAILDCPDDQLDWPLDWQPQPDAVILWLSDMPELNEQTRRKIEAQSDKVYRVGQLITINNSLDQERLGGGKIYFVNTQKLADDRLLTREGDARQFSIWTTFSNTARAIPDRFYVVIDEAHRGAQGRAASKAKTIMQKFVLGDAENGLAQMPMVIGVSATPKRFDDLLSGTSHTVHKVIVPPDNVRESGLLKERIVIHHPKQSTNVEVGLLEEAARRWQRMSATWERYCNEQKEPSVRPILVVQVQDGPGDKLTRTNLSDAIKAIEKGAGRELVDEELAHAFQDSADHIVDGRVLRKVDASRIEEDGEVSVVFFKMALSTGWDCPRAEVMMSYRAAFDHTHIAQLLGRMVRTPLARRIEKSAELNDVHLYLPHFDRESVEQVVKALQDGETSPPTTAGSGADLVVLKRRDGADGIFSAVEDLVTYRVNAHRAQSDLRRYQAIARQLTIDGIEGEVWDAAKTDVVKWIADEVAKMKKAKEFDQARESVAQVSLSTVAIKNLTGLSEEQEDYVVGASDIDVDRLFEEAGRKLGNGLHKEYWKSNAKRDKRDVKIEVIVVAQTAKAMEALERNSGRQFNKLFDKFRGKFGKLPEAQRRSYEKLRTSSAAPSEIQWRLPDSIDFKRSPKDPKWEKHLFIEGNGDFRTKLGSWEEGVLNEELSQPSTVAWLRNLDRKDWSLEIPYEVAGAPKAMYPDLLIVRKVDGGFVFDILEPHQPNLDDNLVKAKGLALFARKHGHLFGRIELLRMKSDGAFSRLNLNKSEIADRVVALDGKAGLDQVFKDFA